MWGGLTPKYSPERCPNQLPYGPQTELLLHPKLLINQIIKNIASDLKDVGIDDEYLIKLFLAEEAK